MVHSLLSLPGQCTWSSLHSFAPFPPVPIPIGYLAIVDVKQNVYLRPDVVVFSWPSSPNWHFAFAGNKLSNAVIAGDFNTYPDFPDPVELFMDRTGQPASERNQCRKSIMSPLASAAQGFQDAWEAIHKDSSGFTFSNMVGIV